MQLNKIHNIDCLQGLKQLDPGSIDCVMTSPPYWALRDYGVDGQLGLEPTIQGYMKKLMEIFSEVKRVLKDRGSCFVNIGDTYSGDKKGNTLNTGTLKQRRGVSDGQFTKRKPKEINRKSLVMIPFRFSIAMVDQGWVLRNTIIWRKTNCMPSSIKDRFTVDFEYLFFFTKASDYHFEQQFTEHKKEYMNRYDYHFGGIPGEAYPEEIRGTPYPSQWTPNSKGANKRCVWDIPTANNPEAHFATYPEELCETPLKAGCPVGGTVLDPFMGSGTTGLVALKQNKKFIGFELSKEYIEIAMKRLTPYLEQTKLTEVL